MRLWVVPAGVLALAACSSLTSRPAFDETRAAPLQLTVTTVPPPADDGVARDALIRLTLDDYPDPDSVVFGNLLLRSGNATFDVEMTVDLVGRAVVMRPRALLSPNTTYEVIANGLRALDGRKLGGNGVVAHVTVGASLNPSPAPAAAEVVWSTAPCDDSDPEYVANNVRCLLSSCAPACHTDRGCSGPRRPSRQLNLVDAPDDGTYGMINVPSLGLRGTAYQLMRVAPGDASRSVLLRKLIGGDHRLATTDDDYPEMRVEGRRMPLQEGVCGLGAPAPFDDSELRMVQDWIDQGARIQ